MTRILRLQLTPCRKGATDRGPSRDKLQKVWLQAAKEAQGPMKTAFDHAAFDFV